MPTQHKVQAGQTLSQIAKEYNVTVNDITGFRSNDPNTIFPGETLTVNQPGVPGPTVNPNPVPVPVAPGQTQTTTPTQATPTPTAPGTPQPNQSTVNGPRVAPAPVLPGQTPAPAPQTTTTATPATPQATVPPKQPALTPQQDIASSRKSAVLGLVEQGVTDPGEINKALGEAARASGFSGSDFTEEEILNAINPNRVVEKYGLSAKALESGFASNPFGTLDDILRKVTSMTGLGNIRDVITNISGEIEDLENERDAQIEDINDNPFISSGTKNARIDKLNDKYELRIKNRTNRLTLEQNAYNSARQEAQFAVTTAIGLYDKNRNFQADQIEAALEAEETRAEAERLSGPLHSENIDGFKVLRDSSGKVVSTKSPESDEDSSGFSKNTQRIIDGFGTLKSLTPAERSKAENELYALGYGDPTPPDWFRQHAEQQARQSLSSDLLQEMWDTERNRIMSQVNAAGSSDDLFDSL